VRIYLDVMAELSSKRGGEREREREREKERERERERERSLRPKP